ncbi:MAG: DUF2007 domain-containing protein [Acidobacteriota bacterium]|nr:DUF2007 domain-containing protein [Acidobacteriota bacterium]
MTSEELITVATFENTSEAAIARGALEAEGIAAFVPGETIGVFAPSRSVPPGSWTELRVRPRDRERAMAALKRAGHR